MGAHIGDNDAGNGPAEAKAARLVVRDPANWPQHQARSNTTKNKRDKTIMGMVEKNSRTGSAINDFEYSSVPMDGCISSARFSVGP